MPIEIRELTIKVNINQDQSQPAAPAGSGGQTGKESDDKQSIIREAVEQMISILDNKKER